MNNETDLAMFAISAIDPEGLHQDVEFLRELKWTVASNAADSAEWTYADGALQMVARQSSENPHRILWELSVMADGTKVGYASSVLRPGDLSATCLRDMIKAAIEAGQAEVAKWNGAIGKAKRALDAKLVQLPVDPNS